MSIDSPTSDYTFRDLVLRVSEYLGVTHYGTAGGEIAQVPTNVHDLDLCKRIVNDGIKMLVAANPKWHWVRRTCTLLLDVDGDGPLNVEGDVGRYMMPADFNGDASGDWTFDQGSNVPPFIKSVPETFIRRQKSIGSNESGIPYWAAFRRLDRSLVAMGSPRRWEVIFYPEPGTAYTVLYRYRASFDRLIDLDLDYSPAGGEMDPALLAACLATAELDRDDVAGARKQFYDQQLLNARAIDVKAAPKNLGQNLDATGRNYVHNRSQLGFDRPTQRVIYNVTE